MVKVQSQDDRGGDGGDADAESAATSDLSISSLGSDDMHLLEERDVGLRGAHGRHGEPQRIAIQALLPLLKEQLQSQGALLKSEKENIKEALNKASKRGIPQCWGPGCVYKSRRNVENAILNLYYSSVVASLQD